MTLCLSPIASTSVCVCVGPLWIFFVFTQSSFPVLFCVCSRSNFCVVSGNAICQRCVEMFAITGRIAIKWTSSSFRSASRLSITSSTSSGFCCWRSGCFNSDREGHCCLQESGKTGRTWCVSLFVCCFVCVQCQSVISLCECVFIRPLFFRQAQL